MTLRRIAKWLGITAIVVFALPAVFLTCYMLGQFGPQLTVRLWVYVIYDFLFGVLA
jgi:hypothetical protein